MFSQQHADTFHLSVTLSYDKLGIVLKDFVDWAIYENYYTKDDIGNEIHQKMDLRNVYEVLSQSKVVNGDVGRKEAEGIH